MEAVPATPAAYTLTDLRRFTRYSVQLLAFNPAGDGPRSQALQVQTLADREWRAILFAPAPRVSFSLLWQASPSAPCAEGTAIGAPSSDQSIQRVHKHSVVC